MNLRINNDSIIISVDGCTNIEKVKIFFVTARKPSAFSNNHENDSKTSGSSRSKLEKPSSKGASDIKSNSVVNMTSVASKVPPPAMSPSRPQQTFYFGQNQEASSDEKTERKQSAVDKVNSSSKFPEIYT